MSNIVPMRKPVVRNDNGKTFADSRDVAEFFEKEHRNVLRDIRNLIAALPADKAVLNFEPFRINDLTGESTSHYLMSRDGFTLLAMGFTGAKVLQWKLDYIEAFNTMEAELLKAKPVLTQFDMMRAVIDNMEAQGQRLFSVEKAVEALGAHEDYRSIKAHAALIGRKITTKQSGDLGKQATAISKQLGHKIGRIPDDAFGQVNSYHRDVLKLVFSNAS